MNKPESAMEQRYRRHSPTVLSLLILNALPKKPVQAMTLDDVSESLNADAVQADSLREVLDKLVAAGLVGFKAGRYWRKQTSGLFVGKFRRTRGSIPFVIPLDQTERARGDVRIREALTLGSLHEDTVVVRVTASTPERREGRVEYILHRANPTVVGRFTRGGKEALVVPLDERFVYDVFIPPASTLNAIDGDIVDVEITQPPAAGALPKGRVLEVIGRENTPGIDVEIIIRKHRLPHEFAEAVIHEAESIPRSVTEDQLEGRVDLRQTLTITIDGETARDFDDAISLQTMGNGRYRLGIHIADVSYYVREGSALDQEAFKRGTSVYFPERVLPMLPERLSNGICSLSPHVDRLAMSVLFDLERDGRILDYHITPSVIHSAERMTYTQVNEILQAPNGEAAASYAHIREMITEMHTLTLVLIERRKQAGAIDFDLPEAELLFNDEGQICGIARSERNIAHRLVEEFMLLANEAIAKHLEALRVPSLYRIHEEPSPTKLEEFADVAESFGLTFSIHGPVPQRGFQHLLREIEGRPEERLLSHLLLRSMERARYSPQNVGHYGLAMKTYTHFTSPIRRYPDLIVHRITREILKRGREGEVETYGIDLGVKRGLKSLSRPVFDADREGELRRSLWPIADRSSETERAADQAEHELMNWRKAEFMSTRIGDRFEAVVTSLEDYGFYVELKEHFIEGLVHVSTLTDDSYFFEPRKHRFVGRRTGKTFRTGDSVIVLVERVDRSRHRIDFSIA